jgi:hypothetical protein
MLVTYENPVETNLDDKDEFQLVDPLFEDGGKGVEYSISILFSTSHYMHDSGSTFFKRQEVTRSPSLEFVLKNINACADLEFQRHRCSPSVWVVEFITLSIQQGEAILFEIPFSDVPLMDDNAFNIPPPLEVDETKVLDADIHHVKAFIELVPGARPQKLKSQVLESGMGL